MAKETKNTEPVKVSSNSEHRSVVSKEIQSPVQKVAGLKTTYYEMFKDTYNQLNPKKPLQGDPTLEKANGHPTLVKYFQNWSKA